jgi:hypothetical protein
LDVLWHSGGRIHHGNVVFTQIVGAVC